MSLTEETKRHYLALSLIPGLGVKRIEKLVAACDGDLAYLLAKPQLAQKVGLSLTFRTIFLKFFDFCHKLAAPYRLASRIA